MIDINKPVRFVNNAWPGAVIHLSLAAHGRVYGHVKSPIGIVHPRQWMISGVAEGPGDYDIENVPYQTAHDLTTRQSHYVPPTTPIDMILHCPACHLQHIDAPEENDEVIWTNPPHRSHLCAGCGHIWRPADVATNGVKAIKTRGTADGPLS